MELLEIDDFLVTHEPWNHSCVWRYEQYTTIFWFMSHQIWWNLRPHSSVTSSLKASSEHLYHSHVHDRISPPCISNVYTGSHGRSPPPCIFTTPTCRNVFFWWKNSSAKELEASKMCEFYLQKPTSTFRITAFMLREDFYFNRRRGGTVESIIVASLMKINDWCKPHHSSEPLRWLHLRNVCVSTVRCVSPHQGAAYWRQSWASSSRCGWRSSGLRCRRTPPAGSGR